MQRPSTDGWERRLVESKHRKTAVALLGSGLLLLFVLLGALNAFNLPFLRPRSASLIFIFTGISAIVFLLFMVLLVLLSRNILKLYADERSRVLGSRLRTRMLIGALLLSFAPALFMFFFSYGLMNRSMDRWFSQPVMQLHDDSTRMAQTLSKYAADNARAEAASLVAGLNQAGPDAESQRAVIRGHRITLQGGFVIVYRGGKVAEDYQLPAGDGLATVRTWGDEDRVGDSRTPTAIPHADLEAAPATQPLADAAMAAARLDESVLATGGQEYAVGPAGLPGGLVVVAMPMPFGLGATVADVRRGTEVYWATFRSRNGLRRLSLSILLLLTALIFFTSSWLALFLSKQITRPVEALADAMDEIADGHYKHRIAVEATEELGELIRSFNHMAADLEESRTLVESSTQQLSAANLAIEERRRELEVILETIPSGVVTLDAELRVLQANRAFLDRFKNADADADSMIGKSLDRIFPVEVAGELMRLVRRSRRMGIASTEFEFRGPQGTLNLSATIARLPLGRGEAGSILVLEDVTEFLLAQRQMAWKEVAQRVAHEIKNPLTPIGLSAERIRKHIDRPTAETAAVIRRCSEVILGSVETMRTLVDQFAALAQFPTAQPRPSDLNEIVESALMLFAGRLEGIRVVRRLSGGIPPVMADPEALKRALANLIDNAAEAMQGSLLRDLTIETCVAETQHAAEIIIGDTGHGLTAEMRERLFLPHFSTKQRGTGLGLAIAAKIVQEHHGAIRAEQNTPVGARFILEVPLAESAGALNVAVSGTSAATLMEERCTALESASKAVEEVATQTVSARL
jgi:two-component system nitrogen regulation sensor histidine kinase NtrY